MLWNALMKFSGPLDFCFVLFVVSVVHLKEGALFVA